MMNASMSGSLQRYPYLLARLVFFLLVGYLTYVALAQASGVLSMLFVSLLAAYVMDPLVDWFEARGISRSLAIGTLVVVIVGFASLLLFWMIPTLVSEFAQVGERLQALFTRDPGDLAVLAAEHFRLELSEDTILEVREKAQEYGPKAINAVVSFLQSAAARSMGVVGWLLNVIMVPVFVFYFLRDFDRMKAWVVEHIPVQHRGFIVERGRRVDNVIGQWLRGQVEVALLLCVVYCIGLSLLGVKLAIPIGILAGLLNVIPYLGFATGFALGLLMVFLDWSGTGMLLAVSTFFITVHLIEGYLVTPRIVGEKVGLSPVTVLIVLLLGGELYGLLGFLLAVPLAGGFKTVLLEVIDWYRNSEHYLGKKDGVEETAADPVG